MLFAILSNIGLPEILIVLATGLLVVWPSCRICSKAGYPAAIGLFVMVPVFNLLLLFLLAFAEWPALRRQGNAPASPHNPSP